MLKGRKDQALAVLRRIGDEATAQATLAEIEATLVERTRPLLSFGGKVIFVGIMMSVFQQFVGINAVLYYGPQMFRNAGFSSNVALLQTIVVGIALVVFTLVALVTVDRWGRKPLLITGAVIMAVSMFALGSLFNAGVQNVWPLVGGGGLHRRFLAQLGPGDLGVAGGNLSQFDQGQGDGDRGGGAMDRQFVHLMVVQDSGRLLGVERDVPSRLCLLALCRDEYPGGAIRACLCAGNQAAQPGSVAGFVEQAGDLTRRALM